MQRGTKLETHMQSLKDLDLVLEELLQWLIGLENTLLCKSLIFCLYFIAQNIWLQSC